MRNVQTPQFCCPNTQIVIDFSNYKIGLVQRLRNRRLFDQVQVVGGRIEPNNNYFSTICFKFFIYIFYVFIGSQRFKNISKFSSH